MLLPSFPWWKEEETNLPISSNHEATNFPISHFSKSWSYPYLQYTRSMLCPANAAEKQRHWWGTAENLSPCFSQLCCVLAGAAEVPFWWPAPTLRGWSPLAIWELFGAAFNRICSSVLLPVPPFISFPSWWGFSNPLSPAPCPFSSANPGPASIPISKEHQSCPVTPSTRSPEK